MDRLEIPRLEERVARAIEAAPEASDAAAVQDVSTHPQLTGDTMRKTEHPSVLQYDDAKQMAKDLEGLVDPEYLREAIEHEDQHAARAEAFGFDPTVCVQFIRGDDGVRVQPFVQSQMEQAPEDSAIHFRRKIIEICRAPDAPSAHDEATARNLEDEIRAIERAEEAELRAA